MIWCNIIWPWHLVFWVMIRPLTGDRYSDHMWSFSRLPTSGGDDPWKSAPWSAPPWLGTGAVDTTRCDAFWAFSAPLTDRTKCLPSSASNKTQFVDVFHPQHDTWYTYIHLIFILYSYILISLCELILLIRNKKAPPKLAKYIISKCSSRLWIAAILESLCIQTSKVWLEWPLSIQAICRPWK